MIKKLILFVVIVALDQWTKNVASTQLLAGDPLPIIPGIFNLTLVFNPGAAFGMFSEMPDGYRRILLAVVSCIALIVVLRFMIREAKNDVISQYALVGILSGALGNLVDRYRFDSVVDFLDFYWKGYHWPAFNIADSAISVGVVVLMLRVVFTPAEKSGQVPVAGA